MAVDCGMRSIGRNVLVLLMAAAATFAMPGVANATHSSDVDCSDFGSQAAAQYHMNAHQGDPDGLDGSDDDGRACESSPCPCYYGHATSPQEPPPAPEPRPAPDPPALEPTPTPAPTAVPAPMAEPPDAVAHTYRGRIVDVVDGDTVKVRLRSGVRKTVRLIGVDAPETSKPGVGTECGGKDATAYMSKLAFAKRGRRRIGRDVRLRSDPTQDRTDRHGRLLAYVSTAQADLGKSLIRAGWATIFVFSSNPFQRFTAYSHAGADAKTDGGGVHQLCGGDFHSTQR